MQRPHGQTRNSHQSRFPPLPAACDMLCRACSSPLINCTISNHIPARLCQHRWFYSSSNDFSPDTSPARSSHCHVSGGHPDSLSHGARASACSPAPVRICRTPSRVSQAACSPTACNRDSSISIRHHVAGLEDCAISSFRADLSVPQCIRHPSIPTAFCNGAF